MKRTSGSVLLFLTFAALAAAQTPISVSICQLQSNPSEYNHQVVRVSGMVSPGFEDFTLFDQVCDTWPRVWLDYGGTRTSAAVYCCGNEERAKRKGPPTIEGISIPLIEDRQFRDFQRWAQSRRFRAAIIGRFFAGSTSDPNGFRGYGHLGCCSLLVIQQVLSVDR